MNHKNKIAINSLPLHFGKKLIGTHGGDGNPEEDIPRYIRLIQSKKINLNSLITNEYKLADINKAIKNLKNGKCLGRTIISMR